jgi:hypothetical protein
VPCQQTKIVEEGFKEEIPSHWASA